jgi:hypothetical protein
MLEEPISKTFPSNEPLTEHESNSLPSPTNQKLSSFSNIIGNNEILPYKLMIKENIKSFNLLPNEENSTKENELENSLKAKYNFDTPTLEIVLKVTSDYETIKDKLREYFELFGKINLVKYDHNANTVKITYKYYFSCLYANRSLNNILQREVENITPMNYYTNCEYSSKSITTTMSSEKNKANSNKNISQAFKFLTENYKTSTRFKTQIYKEENSGESDKCENKKEEEIIVGDVNQNSSNIEEMKSNEKSYIFSPNMKRQNDIMNGSSNQRTKYKSGNSNYSYSTNRKMFKNSFSNPMTNIYNMMFPQNLYYQYLSMNNPNTIKIPVPVPVPVPFPLPLSKQKSNKTMSYNKINNSPFSNQKIKSSFLKQIKETIVKNKNENDSEIQSIDINDSPEIMEAKNENQILSNNIEDSLVDNSKINLSQKSNSKINENPQTKEISSDASKKELNINIPEEKELISNEKNNSSSNTSGNPSKEAKLKNDNISSIKSLDKSSFELLSNMDQKKNSLERLNHYLQNRKPISDFNNPVKNLTPDDMDKIPRISKRIPPFPMFFPYPMKFPFKFPKYNKNNFMMNPSFPAGFNSNIINFDKLTLDTRNTIKFETHSSRDYYYKYVCNYLIQIENDDNFFVTKRIIGKNGCFLKKIIQEACIKFGDFSTKIRLRGKGSGYLEHNGKESEEPLMLCVSSLNYPTYYNCCLLVDSLLQKIYNDYYEYSKRIMPQDLHYSMKKKQILKHEFVVNRFASNSSGNKENNDNNIQNKKGNEKNEENSRK